MATGSGWRLKGFDDRLNGLGQLSPAARRALSGWLEQVARNPAAVDRAQIPLGPHIGETLLGDEKEDAFPPYFRSRIPTGDGGALVCAYFVHPDERSVQCVTLSWE